MREFLCRCCACLVFVGMFMFVNASCLMLVCCTVFNVMFVGLVVMCFPVMFNAQAPDQL